MAHCNTKRKTKKKFMSGGMVKKNSKGKFMYGMGGKVISSTRGCK